MSRLSLKKNSFYVYYENVNTVVEKGYYKDGLKHGTWYYSDIRGDDLIRSVDRGYLDVPVPSGEYKTKKIINYWRYNVAIVYKKGEIKEVLKMEKN